MSAVSPSTKRFSKSSSLKRALSIRVGFMSVASIEKDRSNTSTLACDFCSSGCGTFSQTGPAKASKSKLPVKHIIQGSRLDFCVAGLVAKN